MSSDLKRVAAPQAAQHGFAYAMLLAAGASGNFPCAVEDFVAWRVAQTHSVILY